jgi:hypothetical protein
MIDGRRRLRKMLQFCFEHAADVHDRDGDMGAAARIYVLAATVDQIPEKALAAYGWMLDEGSDGTASAVYSAVMTAFACTTAAEFVQETVGVWGGVRRAVDRDAEMIGPIGAESTDERALYHHLLYLLLEDGRPITK